MADNGRGYIRDTEYKIETTVKLTILSRDRGSVTNYNGFWIGLLDLLTPPFTITIAYNNSQSMTA
jgi:hypothetical protein